MREILSIHILALMGGVLLDLLIGDPHSLPHPVRAIGKLISFLEGKLLGPAELSQARDPAAEKKKGLLLWVIVILVTAAVSGGILAAAFRVHPCAGGIAEAVMTCYILASGSLRRESMAVARALDDSDITAARSALSMIVGRDTDVLTEAEIIKAAVETVAENTTDGVIAPLIYTAVGGPVLGFVYKAASTMDSMLGYRNERYESFGFFAARMDDVLAFIPARISAVLMIVFSFPAGWVSSLYSGRRAFWIWRRDRYAHNSPNSAQTESVCAGALGLKLGGTHLYGGVPVTKPAIGDEIRDPRTADIARANILMLGTEILTVFLVLALYAVMRMAR